MSQQEAVKLFIENVRQAYIADQKSKDIRASGRSADTLRTESTETNAKLYGKAYIEFQKVGRRPGSFPPIDAIIQWLKDKRIISDIPEKSLAFLIARKIAKRGTDIYLGRRPGLNISDKMVEYRKELIANILNVRREAVQNSINKMKTEPA